MKLIITLEQLIKLNACESGIELFKSIYGEKLEVEWTLKDQIEFIKSPLRKYFGWGFRMKILPMYSMQGVNLRRADLEDADLQGANLRGADLRGADLCVCTKGISTEIITKFNLKVITHD